MLAFYFSLAGLPQEFVFAANGKGENISYVGTDEMPDSDIFDDEGTVFNREAYAQWLREGTPEVLVTNMLTGNVAFVLNSKWCWNLTKREEMDNAPFRNDDGEMVIPVKSVSRVFGVTLSGEYATAKDIANVLQGWEYFLDPRGFVLFSHDIDSVINKEPAVAGDIGKRHYRSYYDVQASIAKITWNDINPTKEDWVNARKKVYLAMTLPEGEVDAYNDRYIRELAESVNSYMDKITVDGDATVPFSDCTLYVSFQRVVDMGRLYAILRDKNRNDINREELKTAAGYFSETTAFLLNVS